MVRIASRTIAENLGINRSASIPCGRFCLNYVDPCSLAEHKPITISGKRPRRQLRCVIPRFREYSHQAKTRQYSRGERSIGPAGDHNVRQSAHDGLTGIKQRIRRTRAACGDNVTWAMQSKSHGYFAAERPYGRSRNRIYAGLLRFSVVPVRILPFGEFEPSTPAAQNHGNTPSLIQGERLGIQFRILESLSRRRNGKRRRSRNVLTLFRGKD